jgi:hypothetical protein
MQTVMELAIGVFGAIAGAGAAAQFTVNRDWRYIVMAAIMLVGGAIMICAAVSHS